MYFLKEFDPLQIYSRCTRELEQPRKIIYYITGHKTAQLTLCAQPPAKTDNLVDPKQEVSALCKVLLTQPGGQGGSGVLDRRWEWADLISPLRGRATDYWWKVTVTRGLM